MLCSHHLCQVPRHAHHLRDVLPSEQPLRPFSAWLLAATSLLHAVSVDLLVWVVCINGIMQYMAFYGWHFQMFNMMLERLIHIVQCIVLQFFSWVNDIPLYILGWYKSNCDFRLWILNNCNYLNTSFLKQEPLQSAHVFQGDISLFIPVAWKSVLWASVNSWKAFAASC